MTRSKMIRKPTANVAPGEPSFRRTRRVFRSTLWVCRPAAVHLVLAALAVWFVVSAAPSAFAQGRGVVAGVVFDSTGNPLAGVKMSLESPTQIGGVKTAYSGDDGAFRFLGLIPGTFKLTASAKGLETYTRTGIKVHISDVVSVDIIMQPDTGAAEEIVVEDQEEAVNQNSAAVGDQFDADFIDSLPLGARDYQSVAALAPGVTDSTGTGNPSAMGGSLFDNQYNIDGFNTTDPVSGTFGTNFSFDAIAEQQILTAAKGVKYSDTFGAFIDVVTRSGSNKFEVISTATYTDQNLSLFPDEFDQDQFRAARLSLLVSGPLVKDRLWFLVSTSFTNGVSTIPVDPARQLPNHAPLSILSFAGFGKLTWQMTARQSLSLRSSWELSDFRNTVQSPLVENEAEERQLQRAISLSGVWNAIITDDLNLNVSGGVFESFLDVGPQNCVRDPDGCLNEVAELDVLTGIRRRNASLRSRDARRTFNLLPELTWFKQGGLGTHQVTLGSKLIWATNPRADFTPGGLELWTNGGLPFARTEVCANDPRIDGLPCSPSALKTTVTSGQQMVYLEDKWQITPHTQLIPGVAFHRSASRDDRGNAILPIQAVTPYFQALWDPLHDGKTRLGFSYGHHVDTGFLSLARFAATQRTSRRCFWDESAQAYVGDCRTFGGEGANTIGSPCGPDGIDADGQSCLKDPRAPRMIEYVLSAKREVIDGWVAEFNFIHKRFNNTWEDRETNAIWNEGGTAIRSDGGFRNGRNQFVFDLGTPSASRKRYTTFLWLLRKRLGRFRIFGSYAWSRFVGTSNNFFASPFLDNPGQRNFFFGPLPEDYRHNVRVQSSYIVNRYLTGGLTYQFLSGGPYNRFFFSPELGNFQRFAAQRGQDSQGNLDPRDDVDLRLPDLTTLSVQARLDLMPLIKHRVQVFVDFLNVLALRTTTAVIQANGPRFGQRADRLPPLRMRLGLRYRY